MRRVEQSFDPKNADFDIFTSRFVFFAGDVPVDAWHIIARCVIPTFYISAFFFLGRFFSELVLVLRKIWVICDGCCADNGAAYGAANFAAADAASNSASNAATDAEDDD